MYTNAIKFIVAIKYKNALGIRIGPKIATTLLNKSQMF